MKINFTGHNIEITPALHDIIEKKFHRIENHFKHQITSANVILNVEKLINLAEITVHISGAEIHAKAEADDMYKAIDLMIDKLHTQIMKCKAKEANHRE
jgi:putative sigma-54 modulation protein